MEACGPHHARPACTRGAFRAQSLIRARCADVMRMAGGRGGGGGGGGARAASVAPEDAKRARERWRRTKVWELEPRTVRWLVDSSGIKRAALARMMGVPQTAIEYWAESGRMTYSAMERMAARLRRPVLDFFREPLREPVLADCRRGEVTTGSRIGSAPALVPMDIVAVRLAWWKKARAGEMMEELEREGGNGNGGDKANARGADGRARLSATADEAPESAAGRAAAHMGLSAMRADLGGPPGFDALRDAVERGFNALVFQEPLDMDAVRSVTLAGGEAKPGHGAKDETTMVAGKRDWDFPAMSPNAILLNANDAEGARSFSMLHGTAHILLGRGTGWDADGYICKEGSASMCGRGHCDGASKAPPPDMDAREAWCDSFAAAILMPGGRLVHEYRDAVDYAAAAAVRGAGNTARVSLRHLAETYKASMYAVAVRVIDMVPGETAPLASLIEEVQNTTGTSYGGPAAAARAHGGRGSMAARRCASRLGPRFVRTVLDSEARDIETLHEASVLLDVGVDDVEDVGNLAGLWTGHGGGGG